jgi:hypothetical protein
MNQPTPKSGSGSRRPDLGRMYPLGQRQNDRWWEPPVSVRQAKARVRDAERLFEVNVRDGIDIRWAQDILDEVEDDYREMVLDGQIDENRKTAMAAQIKEMQAECAELHAEAVILKVMRDLEGGAE